MVPVVVTRRIRRVVLGRDEIVQERLVLVWLLLVWLLLVLVKDGLTSKTAVGICQIVPRWMVFH